MRIGGGLKDDFVWPIPFWPILLRWLWGIKTPAMAPGTTVVHKPPHHFKMQSLKKDFTLRLLNDKKLQKPSKTIQI